MAHSAINAFTSISPIQRSLLSNMNRRDYQNMRLGGIPIQVSEENQRENLGARCNERPPVGLICSSDAHSHVRIKLCDGLPPSDNLPPTNHGSHNVCELCRTRAYDQRMQHLRRNLSKRTVGHCKKHSMQLRRRHDRQPLVEGHQGCDCQEHVNAGWRCQDCYQALMDQRTNKGDYLSQVLMHRRKRTLKKGARTGRKQVYRGAPRARHACPEKGCTNQPWLVAACRREESRPAADATFMCLNCENLSFSLD